MDTYRVMSVLCAIADNINLLRAIDIRNAVYTYQEMTEIYSDMNYLLQIGLVYRLHNPNGVYWVLTTAGEKLMLLSRPRPLRPDATYWPRDNGRGDNNDGWLKIKDCRFIAPKDYCASLSSAQGNG